jgi:NADH-ubiquinone oxidoreductase chain 4L
MFYLISIIPWILLITGIMGVILGRKNIILIIISFELILLALTFYYVLVGWCNFSDFKSILFGIFLLAIGASESAVALALAITYYKYL